MSSRQARIARKQAQREGLDAFVHIKPTKGTRPYETRAQTQQGRRITRAANQAATEAAALAMRLAPAARASLLSRGPKFGEDEA